MVDSREYLVDSRESLVDSREYIVDGRESADESRELLVVSRKSGSERGPFISLLSRYALIVGILLSTIGLGGCRNYYKHLAPAKGDVHCIEQFAPQYVSTMYSAYVDVTKHHFSGLLFIKQMPDSSTRILFANEIGVKFFDFSFSKDGEFTKNYILEKMDKKAVVLALKNDLKLVLLHPNLSKASVLTDNTNNFVVVPNKKGKDYYITDKDCTRLVRIEKSSKRKPVVVAELMDYKNGIPDSVHIQHKNFKFSIALKKVEKEKQ